MARKVTETPLKPRNVAEAAEVADFAADLPESFLLCREMGHTWKPYVARFDDEHGYFERVIRCERCRTERHQTLSTRGHVLSSGYDYPDGYQHKGLGRIDGDGRDQLRLESITRAISKEADAAHAAARVVRPIGRGKSKRKAG